MKEILCLLFLACSSESDQPTFTPSGNYEVEMTGYECTVIDKNQQAYKFTKIRTSCRGKDTYVANDITTCNVDRRGRKSEKKVSVGKLDKCKTSDKFNRAVMFTLLEKSEYVKIDKGNTTTRRAPCRQIYSVKFTDDRRVCSRLKDLASVDSFTSS